MDKYNNLISKLDAIEAKIDLVIAKLDKTDDFEVSLFDEIKKAGGTGKKNQSHKPLIETDFDVDGFKAVISKIGEEHPAEIQNLMKSIVKSLGR